MKPIEFARQQDVSYSSLLTMIRQAPPGTIPRSPLGYWRVDAAAAAYLSAEIAKRAQRRSVPPLLAVGTTSDGR
jgi:hypothetical protein